MMSTWAAAPLARSTRNNPYSADVMASLRVKSQSKEDSAKVGAEFAKISIRGMDIAPKDDAPLEEGFIPDKR